MRYLLSIGLIVVVTTLTLGQRRTLLITNPDETALLQTTIEIPWQTVKKAYPDLDTARLRVVELDSGREVVYQFERRGAQTIQALLVQLSMAPRQRIRLQLEPGNPAPVPSKTFCRNVPERYGDFAWENDKVAFRIYGAALNSRSDNAYGTDLWAKRTTQLILNKWYKQNDYHTDHGEGLDYYHVGLTLGAGDIAVFFNDSLQFIHNYQRWEILDNGPLRSTFRVYFPPYTIKGVRVLEVRTVSLDAGSQLSRIQIHIEQDLGKALPMVAGISLRKKPSPLLLDEKDGIIGYWEPTHGNDGTLGVGCVFPTTPLSMLRKYEHALARLNIDTLGNLVYYAGGGWDKAGQLTNADAWFAYLRTFARQLHHQPIAAID